MGGGMSITGQPGGPPTRSGIPIGDLGGGLMAAIGILSALVARGQTGRGQHVDISMLDAQISMLNYMATMHFLSGEIPGKLGNGHFVHVPYNTFPTEDGYIILAVITDNFWTNLMALVDAPDLDTEENRDQPGRWKNQILINRRLSEIFCGNTQAYWVEQLRAARIPCAPVNNLAQALSDPQVLARQMVVDVAHPEGGSVRMPATPSSSQPRATTASRRRRWSASTPIRCCAIYWAKAITKSPPCERAEPSDGNPVGTHR